MFNKIPFHRESKTGLEAEHVSKAAAAGLTSRPYTARCQEWIQDLTQSPLVLMTASATAGLELSLLSLDLQPEEEVILPSFSYPSEANAILLAGGKPVFAEIDPETMELSLEDLKRRVTERTRGVILVHYGGSSHQLTAIDQFCRQQRLILIEDASHAYLAKHGENYLGTVGHFGVYSFHATKNISAGTGGTLLCNLPAEDPRSLRCQMIAENGTDRLLFLQGKVPCYQWQVPGLNVQPSELAMAYLWPQLVHAQELTLSRSIAYQQYEAYFQTLPQPHPVISGWSPSRDPYEGNYHTFFLRTRSVTQRNRLKDCLAQRSIQTVSHFEPLHQAPMGIRLGYARGDLPITAHAAETLLRLPLYAGMTLSEADQVVQAIADSLLEMEE